LESREMAVDDVDGSNSITLFWGLSADSITEAPFGTGDENNHVTGAAVGMRADCLGHGIAIVRHHRERRYMAVLPQKQAAWRMERL
jgi:hypothetical protein